MEAEEEKIVEHAKEAIHALTDKKKNWKVKIGSFLWEILIIIIAVNLTIGFHNWNEKRHERELEKEFLIGIRDDLELVKLSLNNNGFQPTIDYYDSVWIQINENRINKAFIDTDSWKLLNTSYFTYDNSRFENFKSSGYLRLIENDTLASYITNLYSTQLPFKVQASNQVFNDRQHDFVTYIGSKVRIDSSKNMHISEILNNPEVKFQIYLQNIIFHSQKRNEKELINAIEFVINAIDKELKDRFGYEVKKEEGKKQEKS